MSPSESSERFAPGVASTRLGHHLEVHCINKFCKCANTQPTMTLSKRDLEKPTYQKRYAKTLRLPMRHRPVDPLPSAADRLRRPKAKWSGCPKQLGQPRCARKYGKRRPAERRTSCLKLEERTGSLSLQEVVGPNSKTLPNLI